MNPAYEEMTGYKKEECLGKTAREVLPYIEDIWIDIYGHVALTGNRRVSSNSPYLWGNILRFMPHTPPGH